MHLEFFGAAGEVTGSCHILRVGSADERNREPSSARSAAEIARPGLRVEPGASA